MNNIINGKVSNYGSVDGTITTNKRVSGTLSSSTDLSGNIMATILKGLSAYDVAVENGFTGTVEEWLQSLVGNGIESVNIDSQGILTIYFTDNTSYSSPISLKGSSAYEVAVENGFDGTIEEWINSLGITVDVGSVTSGSQISVVNSGDNKNAILDFTFPTNIESLSQDETVIFYCGSATEVI